MKPIIMDTSIKPTNDEIKGLRGKDWYKQFIEDLRAELVETEFNLRLDYIKLYHSVGKQLVANLKEFTEAKIPEYAIAEVVAIDLQKSTSTIQKAIQFYRAFPDLDKFLSDKGKDISWSKVTSKYLPKPAEKVQPPTQKPGEEQKVPPEIHLAWNDQVKLWDIKIAPEDMNKINLDGFKREIESYQESKT